MSAMTPAQREEIWEVIKSFNIYLPAGPLEAHMKRVKAHEDQTWFAWIGKFGLGDPYYFRIHSPVVFCEVRLCACGRVRRLADLLPYLRAISLISTAAVSYAARTDPCETDQCL